MHSLEAVGLWVGPALTLKTGSAELPTVLPNLGNFSNTASGFV